MITERTILAMGCAFVVVAFSLSLCIKAHAHDPERPDLDDWFDHLESEIGLCCDRSEALSIADPDWDVRGGHYRVRINGEWLDVPPDALVKGPNLDRLTRAWPISVWVDGVLKTRIRCFMPGAGT